MSAARCTPLAGRVLASRWCAVRKASALPAEDREWVLALGERFERRTVAAFARYVATLEEAHASLDGTAATDEERLPWDEAERRLHEEWSEAMGDVVLRAGQRAMDGVSGDLKLVHPEKFILDNPHTAEWLALHGSEWITEMTAMSKLAIREQVYLGVVRHQTVRETARDVRSMIGLRSDQARALSRFAAQETATPKRVEAYRKKLIRQRAELIARTETMDGMNAGQQQAWEVAQDRRMILPQSERIWVAGKTDRTCPLCRNLQGQKASLNGRFPSPDGSWARPPRHPNCRCSQSLRTKPDPRYMQEAA